MLAGIGLVLIGLRPWLPLWASYHLANTAVLLGWVLAVQTLRLLLGRGWSWPQMMLWSLVAGLGYSLLYSLFEPVWRTLLVRAGLVALVWYGSALAWQAARRWHSHNAGAIALSWLLLGLGTLAQALRDPLNGLPTYSYNGSWDAGTMALLMLGASVVTHVGFAGLIAERARQARTELAQAQLLAEEQARLQASLQHSERQTRLVLVSGTLAHELNQPLTAAHAQIELTQRLLQKGQLHSPLLPELFDETEDALQRTQHILERTREAALAQPMPLQNLDLDALLQDVIAQFRADWRRHGIAWQLRQPEGPLWCRGHPVALSQLLVNLLRNATQAVLAGAGADTPKAAQRVLSLDIECGPPPSPERPVQRWHLRLRDSGPGVPAEVLARWGDPFVSTRREGLGLGLAISRAIAEQHHGQLLLRNHPEGGAEAELQLPLGRHEGAPC